MTQRYEVTLDMHKIIIITPADNADEAMRTATTAIRLALEQVGARMIFSKIHVIEEENEPNYTSK